MSTDNESGATVGNAWRGDDAEHINKHAVGPGDFKAPGKNTGSSTNNDVKQMVGR